MCRTPSPHDNYSLRRVFGGAGIYTVGEALSKSVGLFLIPLYTRVLTQAEYGIVGYLEAVLRLLAAIAGLGLLGAQSVHYWDHVRDDRAVGRLLSTMNLTHVATGCILIMVAVALVLIGLFDGPSSSVLHAPFVLLTVATALLRNLGDNVLGWYRTTKQYVVASVLHGVRFLTLVVYLVVGILLMQRGVYGYAIGTTAAAATFAAIFYPAYLRYFRWPPSWADFRYGVGFGAPIVVHLVALQVHSALDRVILERFVSLELLGLYTLSATMASGLNVLIVAFNNAFQPSYFSLMASDSPSVNKIVATFKVWLLLLTVLAVIALLVSKVVVVAIAGDHFLGSVTSLRILFLAVYLGAFYYFFMSPLFFFKRTRLVPIVTVSSSIANIGLNFLLIPHIGIVGAAAATALSQFVQSTVAFVLGRKVQPVGWPIGAILLGLAVVGTAFYAVEFLWT